MDATQGYNPDCWSQRYAESKEFREWKQIQAVTPLMREAAREREAFRAWVRKELRRP